MYESPYGNRWICFNCQASFFDLRKKEAICPRCGADQADDPSKMEMLKSEQAVAKPEDNDIVDDIDIGEDEVSTGMESFEQLEEAAESKGSEEENY